jgi:transcriptional/translational regulatory protein YebC/TACO1
MEELTYEGYAPGGVAVLVEVMTDNRNRTVAEVRHAFTKRGGNLGTDGSVAYLFSRTGLIQFAPGADEDAIMEIALESGAEDVVTDSDGAVDVLTQWESVTGYPRRAPWRRTYAIAGRGDDAAQYGCYVG